MVAASAIKQGSRSSRSEDPDLADEEDNSDDQLKIIKFGDIEKSPGPNMVNRDSSPLSPMKKRHLGESTETDLSSRKETTSGFGGFSLKTTVDINTNNFGAEMTGSSSTSTKKKGKGDYIPANPILPKMVFNEMKQPPQCPIKDIQFIQL